MPIDKTHDLKPGMILAHEIQNHSGRKLLPERTVLTDEYIFTLKAWGIPDVDIQVRSVGFASTQETGKIDPQKLAKAKKESEALFCFSNQDHPAVVELMRLSSLNRFKKMPGMGHVNVK